MNSSQKTETNTIDMHRLLTIFRSHYRVMILWTVVVAILGFAVSRFVIIPKYTATTEVLVNQKHSNNNNGQAYNNQQADIQMINTYKDIITNQVILSKVSKQLNSTETARKYGRTYDLSADELKDDIKISNQQNSQVFSVAVKTDNPQESAAAANTIAKVFRKQIKKIMSVNNVTIVSEASTPNSPSFPNIKLITLAGAVLGLLLSAVWLVVKDMTDTTINTDEFLTEELGLTNLGHINHMNMQRGFKPNRQRREDTHGEPTRRV